MRKGERKGGEKLLSHKLSGELIVNSNAARTKGKGGASNNKEGEKEEKKLLLYLYRRGGKRASGQGLPTRWEGQSEGGYLEVVSHVVKKREKEKKKRILLQYISPPERKKHKDDTAVHMDKTGKEVALKSSQW